MTKTSGRKTALVLSAGGMFGAYQAGVWSALEAIFQPDAVVGTSVGALNAWHVATGRPAAELVERWLTLESLARLRWRAPRSLWSGILDVSSLDQMIRDLHHRGPPRIPVGVVVTELPRLRPRLFRDHDIEWRHLAASCAVLGLFPQQRIDGSLLSDGGLLGALPLWAAVEMGCQRIVAVNALPRVPWPVRGVVQALRAVSPHRTMPAAADILTISPERPLGTIRHFLSWNAERSRLWVEQGRQDAARAAASLDLS